MEDSYMAAVRSETQQKMRSYSFELKYLIAGHTKAYQGEGQKGTAACLLAGGFSTLFHTSHTCLTLPNVLICDHYLYSIHNENVLPTFVLIFAPRFKTLAMIKSKQLFWSCLPFPYHMAYTQRKINQANRCSPVPL